MSYVLVPLINKVFSCNSNKVLSCLKFMCNPKPGILLSLYFFIPKINIIKITLVYIRSNKRLVKMGRMPWKEYPHIIEGILTELLEFSGNEVKEVMNKFLNNV